MSLLPIDAITDGAGNLYIVDFGYPVGVRRVPASSGRIASVAGIGPITPDLGDNGPALDAWVYYPLALFVDEAGNLYIADTANQRIRAVRGPLP